MIVIVVIIITAKYNVLLSHSSLFNITLIVLIDLSASLLEIQKVLGSVPGL